MIRDLVIAIMSLFAGMILMVFIALELDAHNKAKPVEHEYTIFEFCFDHPDICERARESVLHGTPTPDPNLTKL